MGSCIPEILDFETYEGRTDSDTITAALEGEL